MKLFMKIKLNVNRSIATLAIIAAITGTAAAFIPSSAPTLSIVSTISGAASTIISVYQPNPSRLENTTPQNNVSPFKKDSNS